jgi:CRISPR-associated protein Cas2
VKKHWISQAVSSSPSDELFDTIEYNPGPFFRTMWLICAFDLPTDTKLARRKYTQYRKLLLAQGFDHLQHSVYCRHFPNFEQARSTAKRMGTETPDDGKVDFLFLTDKQLGLTLSFLGSKTRNEPIFDEPDQGELF